MNAPSLLFDEQRLAGCLLRDGNVRRDRFLFEFGSIDAQSLTMKKLERIEAAICSHERLRDEWRRAMAEEVLLCRAEGRDVPPHITERFMRQSPFGNGVTLHDCWDQPCSIGVFPLAGKDAPGLAHIWTIMGLDVCDPKARGSFPAGVGVCFVIGNENWLGDSWQLAGRLALRALENGSAGKLALGYLARNWIVTGAVQGERVERIEMGNKLDLPVSRKWLIPLENVPDVPPSASHKRIFSAAEVSSAWAHVSGQGTHRDPGERSWPAQVDELHILIGGDLKTAIATALLCSPSTQIHLWHSEHDTSSRIPAKALDSILRDLCPQSPRPHRHELSSSDMVADERMLRDHFGNLDRNKRVLFNVTSGNRLMSYAAQSAARLHPRITLIYREIGSPPLVFVYFDYSLFPARSGVMKASMDKGRIRLDSAGWNLLFSSGVSSEKTADDMAGDYILKIRSNMRASG